MNAGRAGKRTVPATLAVVAAFYLVGLTGLYDPLFEGKRDDSWIFLAGAAGAQFALGVIVREWWTAGLAVLPALAAAGMASSEGSFGSDAPVAALFTLVVTGTAAIAATAAGVFIGRVSKRRWPVPAAVALVVVLLPGAWAGGAHVRRAAAGPLPEAAQDRLREVDDFARLCRLERTGAGARPADAEARRSFRLLVRELERDPHQTLTRRFTLAHEPGHRFETWTVKEIGELARERLARKGPCPRLERRLEAALD